MKKFLVKSLCIVILFSVIILVGGYNYGVGMAGDKSDYMGSIIEKHHRLNSIQGKRLIFAGGSNLAMGLDSKKVQDSLEIPVVNLGLHAGIGLDFILNELKENIKPGDIVILSVEYFLSDYCSPDLFANTVSYYPEARNYVNLAPDGPFKNIKKWLTKKVDNVISNKNYLTSLFKKEDALTVVYSRSNFNEYGDCESHLNLPYKGYLVDGGPMPYRYWEGFNKLNDFNSFASSKKVAVYFMYPCFPKSEYEMNVETLKKLHTDLESNLAFPVLGGPEDFVFDDNLFFDTVYHLRRKGREMRTDKIIELLDKSLK